MSESRIISQCAPTLAGIKTGSLFPHPYDSKEQVYRDIREINRRLIPKGLCLIPLRFTEKNVLLYLYRPAWLRRGSLRRDSLRSPARDGLHTLRLRQLPCAAHAPDAAGGQ